MDGDRRPEGWEGLDAVDGDARRRLDELLSLLADRRRRDLLYHLGATEITDVETLAELVAAMEEEVPVDAVPDDDRQQVEIELVHRHLPKLADAGAIEFDRRSRAIRSRDLPPLLERLTDTCRDVEEP